MVERASFWNRNVTYGQVAAFGVTWVVLSTVRDLFGIGASAAVAVIGFIGVTLLELAKPATLPAEAARLPSATDTQENTHGAQ